MTEKKLTARAVVTVTLELRGSDTWGSGCSILQVQEQATAAARRMVHKIESSHRGIQVIGEIAVKSLILMEEESK